MVSKMDKEYGKQKYNALCDRIFIPKVGCVNVYRWFNPDGTFTKPDIQISQKKNFGRSVNITFRYEALDDLMEALKIARIYCVKNGFKDFPPVNPHLIFENDRARLEIK